MLLAVLNTICHLFFFEVDVSVLYVRYRYYIKIFTLLAFYWFCAFTECKLSGIALFRKAVYTVLSVGI